MFIDERADGATYGRFREAVAQFDTSLNWKLTRRTTLYVQGRNITGQPLRWFDTPPGVAGAPPAHPPPVSGIRRQLEFWGQGDVLNRRHAARLLLDSLGAHAARVLVQTSHKHL